MNIYVYIAMAIIGYLLGSVSFAVIMVKKTKGVDVRDTGSGNAGTTNVYRTSGMGMALLVLILDVLKGFVPVILAIGVGKLFKITNIPLLMYVVGLCVIIGHTFPVFFKFKGGKGAATYLGMLLAINPTIAAIGFCFGLVLLIITKMMSVASITVSILVPILMLFLGKFNLVKGHLLTNILMLSGITLVLMFHHRSNIARLIKGEENKINLSLKKHANNEE